jgi:LysR family nitrogen assimilation transcriptional regulator
MDLVSLRYFAETARQRSISKAALTLGVVQPALSRRIQLLEDELGVPLLTRHRRGVEPTEAGQLLCERAELVLRITQQIDVDIRLQTAEPAGQVTLGFPPSIGLLFVGRLMSDALRRYPQLKLGLQEDYTPAVRNALLSGRLDLGVMSCEAPHPDLDFDPLFRESMWLVGRPQEWRFGRQPLRPEALDGRPLIVGSFMRTLLERSLRRRAVDLTIVAEIDSLSLAREAIRAGAGFMVAPYSALDRELRAREFVGAPIAGLEVTRGLFRHRSRPLARAGLTLAEMIRTEAAQLCRAHPERFRPLKAGKGGKPAPRTT